MCSLIFLQYYLKLFSLPPPQSPSISLLGKEYVTDAASGAKLHTSVFSARRSRSRELHIVGICSDIPRARYERLSSMCTLHREHFRGSNWVVFGICPPPQAPCNLLTPLAAQIGICPYGRPPRLPPAPCREAE